MTKVIIGLMLAGALLVGCDKGGEGAKGDGTAKSGEKAEKGEKGEKGGMDSIGIKECDEYIKKAEACTSKMPEPGRAPWKEGIKASHDAWKAAAAGPGKDAIAASCKTSLETLAANPACK